MPGGDDHTDNRVDHGEDRIEARAPGAGPAGEDGIEAGPPSPRRASSLAIAAYVLVLAAAAIALAARAGIDTVGRPLGPTDWLALPAFAALLVAAEYLIVRFRFRGEVDGLNLIEAVLAPVIVIFPVPHAVALVAGSQLVAAVVRRNQPLKGAFNVAQWSLAAAAGAVALHALAPGPGPLPVLAALLVVLGLVGMVNHLAFLGALALAGRQRLGTLVTDLAPGMVQGWVVGWALNSVIGLLFVLAYRGHPVAVLLFPVPIGMLHLAYRGFAAARSDRVRLTGLHRAASVLADPLDPSTAVVPFLAEVAAAFEATGALLVLDHEAHVTIDHVDARTGAGHRAMLAKGDARRDGLFAGLLALEAPVRISATGSHPLSPAVAARGWRDALASPMVRADGRRAALVVLDQVGLEGFEAGELAVLEAVAREAASTLDKGALLASVVEERRRFAQIFDSTSDGILTVDADGIVRSWNAALETMTGLPATAVLGRSVRESLGGLISDGRAVELDRWAAGAELPAEVELAGPGGAHRLLDCSYSRADADADRRQVLVVIARDVTETRQVEHLREEVGRLSETAAQQRDVVAQLHQALIPDPPSVVGVELAVQYLPSDESAPTGGDLYDWQLLPSGELHVAVVDVLGHGVAATKHAVAVTTTLRTLVLDGCPFEELLGRADELLGRADAELVATAAVVRYDPATGQARVACAGHPPALAVQAEGQVETVSATGGAIGWPAAGSEATATVQLTAGDALVLYTDGLVEARKDIVQGLDDLRRNAAALAGLPAADVAQQLVDRSLAGADRRDDALALVLRCTAGRTDTASRSWRIAPSRGAVSGLRHDVGSWLVGAGVPSVVADDVLIALAELVNNAVTAARTSVQVRVGVTGEEVALEVRDDGPGLTGSELGKIPIEQLGRDTPPVDAEHGRGLAIVRRLLDAFHLRSDAHGTVAAGARRLRDGASPVAAITPARGTSRPDSGDAPASPA